jgi:hypothetical protein
MVQVLKERMKQQQQQPVTKAIMLKDGNDDETALRKSFATFLDTKRKSMEHEADAIYLESTTPPSEGVELMDIDTRMVDKDGLTEESPVPSRNNSIDNALMEDTALDNTTPQQPSRPAFPRNAVAMGSPADLAGLEEDDLILEFGPWHAENHNHLKAIADLVPQMADEQTSIPILLKRRRRGGGHHHHHLEETTLTILLLPRPWSGRGLIGCHIIPYNTLDA